MLSLGLSASEEASFNDALVDSKRAVRFRAYLWNRAETKAKEVTLLGGEVVVDTTSRKQEPTRTAHVTLLDPHRSLTIDATHPEDGGLWFSKYLDLRYGVYVRDLARWIDVPVFYGHIFEVSRHGIEIDIDAHGKDAQHLPPYVFKSSMFVERGTKVYKAIREIFERRGEDKFNLDASHRRLRAAKTWGAGANPWKAGQNLADSLDQQLFYRGNGRLRLRDVPELPVWKFTEGANAIVTEDPEERFSLEGTFNSVLVRGERTETVQLKTETKLTAKTLVGATSLSVASAKNMAAGRRVEVGGRGGNAPEVRTITGSYTPGSLTVPLNAALDLAHGVGAPVFVRHKENRSIPVVGRADLAQNHPLSAEALTGGKRPRVRVEDRPSIHKKERAKERAEAILKRMRLGIEQEISFAALPVPHLEEGDLVKLDVAGVEKRARLRRFSIPLSPDGEMEVNWIGRRAPRKRRR